MPARYEIIESERLKYVVIDGATNYQELEKLFYRYIRDPAFKPDLQILADLRGLTDVISGLWEIRKLKDLYQYAYHDAVAVVGAVILTGEGVGFKAARAFKFMMRDKKPIVIHIVKDMTEAQKILKVSDETLTMLSDPRSAPNVVSFRGRG